MLGFFLLLISSVFAAGLKCNEANWTREPEMVDGHFVAEAFTLCELPVGHAEVWSKRLKERLQTESRIEKQQDGKYEVVTETDDLKIWETVTVTTTKQDLSYAARSKRVEGSQLKAVTMEIQFKFDKTKTQARFRNFVKVKRPWFAPSFLFFSMAKGITLDKFAESRKGFVRPLLKDQ